ncbi:MAG: TPM domain-containing protein [Proteobacteria bacterium]|nr:TPM domain-containing protein [Pseudomonadota bacterium]
MGALAGALVLAFAAPALAAPTFPALTGRVVDDAHVLKPDTEAKLDQDLQALEQRTQRQLVVVTLPSLQGYDIADYGYQLGRAWGIGRAGKNDGALFIVAPTEHKVRVEVGYGLEPILTDALSSVILQETVIPKFRAGDIDGGVLGGTEAIIQQLSLDEPAAQAKVQAAAQQPKSHGGIGGLIAPIILFFIIAMILRGGRGGGLGWLLPMLILSGNSRRGGGWGDGGGGGWGGGGGGGFSGGGGSFGGGGASGSW